MSNDGATPVEGEPAEEKKASKPIWKVMHKALTWSKPQDVTLAEGVELVPYNDYLLDLYPKGKEDDAKNKEIRDGLLNEFCTAGGPGEVFMDDLRRMITAM